MKIIGRNESEHLILLFDKNTSTYEDVTSRVFYLNDEQKSWCVSFTNRNETKYYHFRKNDLLVSKSPKFIDFDKNKVFINGKHNKDLLKILKFENLGYKLFFTNSKTLYVKDILFNDGNLLVDYMDLHVSNSGNNIFDYYKTLAKYASEMTLEDSDISKILFNLYKTISGVNPESVLNAYTKQAYRHFSFDESQTIYPFSTNLSQMTAVKNTFENELSVISGPPGTGKTQVILNLIANSVVQGKKIAIISNNNTAVENVFEKMKEYGFDFILAYLGKSDNVEKFFQQEDPLSSRLEAYKNISNINEPISSTMELLQRLYASNNQLVLLKQERYELNEEFEHFQQIHPFVDCSNDFKQFNNYQSYLDFKYYLLSLTKISFFKKLILKFKYKFKLNSLDNLNGIIDFIDYKYYGLKIKEKDDSIAQLDRFINTNNLDNLNRKLKSLSRDRFISYVVMKYERYRPFLLTKENYLLNFSKFTERYPVILSTTHSLLRNCQYGFKFDLLVIDEASQSDILTTLLTMNVAKQMVIVGDDRQLPQIDNQDIYEASERLVNYFDVPKVYQYKENSILNSVLSLPKKIKNTILREHYRCDSRIIEFCNKKFYNNELIICTNTSINDPLLIVKTVEGNHARKNPNGTGYYNDREAMEVIEILNKNDEKDIGIITPFRCQAEYIKNLIREKYPYVEVDTIHKYQGRQKKIIILSTVVNDLKEESDDFITNFVTNNQLLNVAISRAIDKLFLVVSNNVFNSKNNTIAQFIDYIKYYCRSESIEQGKVISIFDKLYTDNQKLFMQSPCQKFVDSYAEGLMFNLLKDILKDYPDYKIQLHVRLLDLLRDLNGFNNYEINYITHPKTHVDFVVFDKISKKPVLCIEVDGVKYHDYNILQIGHDNIKTRVLESNQLKLLRLKTNQSNEAIKIMNQLRNN